MNNQPSHSHTIKSLLSVISCVDRHIRKILLCEYLRVNHNHLIVHDSDPVENKIAVKYLQAINAMEQGRPLAYILGKQHFWNHEFLVNEFTLIPRPDTEILIETILAIYKNSLSKNFNILDLGTGTGCIAVTLAEEFRFAQVTAIDISKGALQIAQQNADKVGVTNIKFLQGNWFESLSNYSQKFNIIVSNPPYIDPNDPHLANLRDEPLSALVSQDSGMRDINHIVHQSISHLEKSGFLAIEHGYNQGEQVRAVFDINNFHDITTVKDYGGNDRITYGIYK